MTETIMFILNPVIDHQTLSDQEKDMSLWGVALIAIVLQKDINHLNFGPMKQVTVYIRSHYAVK